MLTYGMLFSGIDGFAVAFDRLGWNLQWQVEQDQFCLDVLTRHWPHVPKHRDVCHVGSHNLPRVDVIAGGFPCQDISVAGAGAGLAGARSGLWSEFVRIIGEMGPRYVVVENVSALLARGMGTVLSDLAALGYDAEWDCIPASAVGAPHRRDRVWIVAYPNGGSCGVQPLAVPGGSNEAVAGHNGATRHVADTEGEPIRPGLCESAGPDERSRPRNTERSGQLQDTDSGALQPWRIGGRAAQAGGPEWWSVEPPVGRVAHGISNRLDQLAALGNALVPQIPEWIGRRVIEWERVNDAANR